MSRQLRGRAARWFLAAAMALQAGAAVAATYPQSTISFPQSTITFPTVSITFGSSQVLFPSSLMQTETARTIEITLPADILFDFDKSDIRAEAQGPLHEVADLLRAKARGPVAIHGYTDGLGNDAHNQRLSERRAASVKTWLATKEGLVAMKFSTTGLGAHDPVAPNRSPDGSDNPAGRQLNRRVTLVISK